MKASLRQALEERSAKLDGDIAQAAAEVTADTGASESLRVAVNTMREYSAQFRATLSQLDDTAVRERLDMLRQAALRSMDATHSDSRITETTRETVLLACADAIRLADEAGR